MKYLLYDCKVLDILVQAQSSGGHSKITLHAIDACSTLTYENVNYA